MAITKLSDVLDTAIALLPGYDYNRWTQLMQTRQNYFFFNTMLKNKKVIQNGGPDIRWTLAHDTSANGNVTRNERHARTPLLSAIGSSSGSRPRVVVFDAV